MTRYDTTKMYPLDATVGRWFGYILAVALWSYLLWEML